MSELKKVGDITPIDFMPYRDGKILKQKGYQAVIEDVARRKFKLEASQMHFHFDKRLFIFEIFVIKPNKDKLLTP